MHVLSFILIAAATIPLELTPVPQEAWSAGGDPFIVAPTTPVVVSDTVPAEELTRIRSFFRRLNLDQPVLTAGAAKDLKDPAIYVGRVADHPASSNRRLRGTIEAAADLPPQGYVLAGTAKYLLIAGADAAGVYHGLATLEQLLRETGLAVPPVEIRDYPDLAFRGVYADGRLSGDSLGQLAGLKCNAVVFASGDFLGMSGERARAWRTTFEEARQVLIEPIPHLPLVNDTRFLLERAPEAARAKAASEEVVLAGDAWTLLATRNILDTPAMPIQVRAGRIVYKRNVDYTLEPGEVAWPYEHTASPWLIRRIVGSAIPDGTPVTVSSVHIPPGTRTLSPGAKATEEGLTAAVADLVRRLNPDFVHIGPLAFPANRDDPRSREVRAPYTGLVQTLAKALAEAKPHAQLLVTGSPSDLPELPPNVSAVPANDSPESTAALRESFEELPNRARIIGSFGADPLGEYMWCTALAQSEPRAAGVLIRPGDLENPASWDAVHRTMNKAWSLSSPRAAWAEGLNTYFGAALWLPSYEESVATLVEHLNRRFLAGHSPKDEAEAFEAALETIREQSSGDSIELELVAAIHDALVKYAELELDHAKRRSSGVPRTLSSLVARYAEVDPNLDEERASTIIAKIRGQRLFVPSELLFGAQLLPYRETMIPAGAHLLEWPGKPTYEDAAFEAHGIVDFLAAPGPLFRVDFDSVASTRVRIAESDDGNAFRVVKEWEGELPEGVRGPLLIEDDVTPRVLRVSVVSPNEHAILRNLRVSAIKPRAEATCTYATGSPLLDGRMNEAPWPRTPQITGLVRDDAPVFAEATTAVRICRARSALYVGVEAFEPRMRTMVARHTTRDAPLTEEESVTVVLDSRDGHRFAFTVNPLGTQHDARDGDAAWDGAWRAACNVNDTGWVAELELPNAVFSSSPGRLDVWGVNVTRTRRNVRTEHSAWAVDEDGEGDRDGFGRLAFE
jgi:glycosyl hydrolase family 20